jgi:hypothetical protein
MAGQASKDVQVVIVSHKRAGRVTTHRYVDKAKVCVPKAQFHDYARHHAKADLLVHPDGVVGLPAKRQWVYETVGDVFMLDDDCIGLFRIYRYKGRQSLRSQTASPGRVWEIIQACADTARQMGAYLYGFESHANPLTFDCLRPFCRGGYSPGGAIGLLAGSKLWWPADTTLPIDDYWICLLNAYYHRFAWYDGRFAFGFKDTYRGAGGMAEYRVGDTEREATAYLVKHFGSALKPKGQRRGDPATKRQRNPWSRTIVMPYRV